MRIVVVGGGLAGAKAVEELRKQGYDDDLTLLAAERHLPYERPPLSKELLLGKGGADDALVHEAAWYDEHAVDLRTGTAATALDTRSRVVRLADGGELAYDRLLLATGATPRHLRTADESGAPVAYLRTLDDAESLRPRLRGHLLFIGAGWIGLEVAAAAREHGAGVTVVDPASQPLVGALGPRVAPLFADLHREHGVDLRLEETVDSIAHSDAGTRVTLGGGDVLEPDLLVVGIGALPDDALARDAGLDVDNGVLVDEALRASAPDVWAAGDVANHLHPQHGRLRVEHWDTAIKHGRHAARGMLGDDSPYDAQPFFYTDQYDLGMEYVGHVADPAAADVVVRGDEQTRVVSILWIADGQVAAGMHLNDWDAMDPLRALVGQEATDRVRDPSVPLADLV
jgi:3-phenylpropionate/trans-cinnamate dioxygenase ferredoxin reductase subunit